MKRHVKTYESVSPGNHRPLFDAYVVVDWSARNGIHPESPTADAVWIGEYAPTLSVAEETYIRTRRQAAEYLENRLRDYASRRSRVLLGFDFAYAWPAGLAHALGFNGNGPAWRQLWDLVADRATDSSGNLNNRFEVASEFNRIIGTRQGGPFWGCPKHLSTHWLSTTSPAFPFAFNGICLNRLRIAESRLSDVQSPWKLYGIGSVGGQSLTGIPYLFRLRYMHDLAAFSRIWPFETGFSCESFTRPGPLIVHAEIWPGLVENEVALYHNRHPEEIRDQIQVRTLCRWIAMQDQDHKLGKWFAPPEQLSAGEIRTCIEQEGWILGAK